MRPFGDRLGGVPDFVGGQRLLELDVVPGRPFNHGGLPGVEPRPALPNGFVSPLARLLEQSAVTPQPVGWKLLAAIVGAQVEIVGQPAQIVGVGLPYLDKPVGVQGVLADQPGVPQIGPQFLPEGGLDGGGIPQRGHVTVRGSADRGLQSVDQVGVAVGPVRYRDVRCRGAYVIPG